MSIIKAKMTPWFPGTVRPARPGVYQRRSADRIADGFSYWTGKRWMSTAWCVQAAPARVSPSIYQCSDTFQWRGLAKEPQP